MIANLRWKPSCPSVACRTAVVHRRLDRHSHLLRGSSDEDGHSNLAGILANDWQARAIRDLFDQWTGQLKTNGSPTHSNSQRASTF